MYRKCANVNHPVLFCTIVLVSYLTPPNKIITKFTFVIALAILGHNVVGARPGLILFWEKCCVWGIMNQVVLRRFTVGEVCLIFCGFKHGLVRFRIVQKDI